MDFSSKTNAVLKDLVAKLEIEVEMAGKKPTKDELVATLEAFEKQEPDLVKLAMEELGIEIEEDQDEDDEESGDNVDELEVEKPNAKKEPEDGPVYTYKKGDKDPTTYDVGDINYGHVDGPRHKAWMKSNG